MDKFPGLPLTTDRLRLRIMQPEDAPDLLAIFGNAEVVRYWSHPCWTSLAEAQAMLARDATARQDGTALRLGIEMIEAPRIIGTLSLFNLSAANRRGEIGYALARECWGRGLMHEALTRFAGWLFDTLALRRLEADIDPANRASAASLRRIGFQREGLLRERWLIDGTPADTELYGLLAHEWRAGR
ncbi:GNAT family protein [Dyella sp.]|jgi:RimJ/RimL family protein N-acetyltransferase|uniref:GNAT family N-acetyltransferase n=1 Tax=Dyella sp. TaxID=1869338 RepID=UPI002D794218|nr:GNAT family protein [Dyella sp.]HET6433301.1 GNAT family protein [Dyella sp.]